MKKLLSLFIYLFPFALFAQLQQAFLQEDGTIQVEAITIEQTVKSRSSFQELPGFPKVMLGNPTFKNFRNVALADLNGDGAEEIIFGVDNKLYAYTSEGLFWEKSIIGTAIYPPTVADADGDGKLDILLSTGGISAGRLYMVDSEGTDWPNFPLNFDDNWMLSSPVFSDVDGDGQMEIIASERDAPSGNIHILNLDGKSFSSNWPQRLNTTPAVTPSVGDVDGDGEKEIVVFSTTAQYIFNLDGSILEGYPIEVEGLKHSYQSPILVDLNRDAKLDIVSAGHGDNAEYFARDFESNYLEGWPNPVPFDSWTFSTPSVMKVEGNPQIFMSRPFNGEEASEMLYGWNGKGALLDDFPIVKIGGLEGIIAIADVDDDKTPELVFGSNLFDPNTETGFIHAYEMDGSGEVVGFPIRPKGWTFINGAAIGDVNGDGKMDVVALTYTQNFGTAIDSAFLHVYDLEVPYAADRVWWATYKGNNSRDGLFEQILSSNTIQNLDNKIKVYPNPARDYIQLEYEGLNLSVELYNTLGQQLRSLTTQEKRIDLSALEAGIYFLIFTNGKEKVGTQKLVLQK